MASKICKGIFYIILHKLVDFDEDTIKTANARETLFCWLAFINSYSVCTGKSCRDSGDRSVCHGIYNEVSARGKDPLRQAVVRQYDAGRAG